MDQAERADDRERHRRQHAAQRWDTDEALLASPGGEDIRGSHSTRRALGLFVVAVVAGAGSLAWLGRGRWFKHDEWDFLAARRATSLHDLFAPHVVHWSTLPILVYRVLWRLVGLRTYLPYQSIAIGSHLVVVALLRAVMRRAGVSPWVATAMSVLFMFFGAGYDNILLAFGMTFSGAVAFGLVQLLLVDHDGPADRRDGWGLVAGLAALLCSGIGVTMVVVVGACAWVRRGWRVAALHTGPLAAVYLCWYASIGSSGYRSQKVGGALGILRFGRRLVGATLQGFGQAPYAGSLVVLLMAIGLWLACRATPRPQLRQVAAVPVGCLSGALFFFLVTSIGRWDDFSNAATPTRYTYVGAALLVTPIAIAVDAVVRLSRWTAPALAALLVVSIVGNIASFPNYSSNETQRAYGDYLLALPRLPLAGQVPSQLHPELVRAPWVTIGWLRDAVRSGRTPTPEHVTPVDAATWELTLVLRRDLGHKAASCQRLSEPASVVLQRGSSIKTPATIKVVYTNGAGIASRETTFGSNNVASILVAYAGPLALRVTGLNAGGSFSLCDRAGAAVVLPPQFGG